MLINELILDFIKREKPAIMKKNRLITAVTRIIFYTAVTLGMLLPSCKSDELKDQIMVLTQQQALLSNEKDSLFKIIDAKKVEYDTLTASYNSLSEANKALLQKINAPGRV